MADWQAIKTEYITTQTSYRKLAQKYGIHYKVISERGKDEGWVELRSQHLDKTLTKTLDKISKQQADKMARIDKLTDKLLDKLEKAITELDLEIIKRKTKMEEDGLEVTTETMEAKAGGIVDRQGLKQIASALKDIKEAKMLRSELDRQEQEARIANLRKQADKGDDKVEGIEVVFLSGEEAWHG